MVESDSFPTLQYSITLVNHDQLLIDLGIAALACDN